MAEEKKIQGERFQRNADKPAKRIVDNTTMPSEMHSPRKTPKAPKKG